MIFDQFRLAVGDVAELDEHGLAARPVAARVDDPGGAGDRQPRLAIAVEIANGDETLRLLRRC